MALIQTLVALIIAALPNAIIAVASKLLTQQMAEIAISKITVAGLKKLAAMTSTSIGDDLVREVEKLLAVDEANRK